MDSDRKAAAAARKAQRALKNLAPAQILTRPQASTIQTGHEHSTISSVETSPSLPCLSPQLTSHSTLGTTPSPPRKKPRSMPAQPIIASSNTCRTIDLGTTLLLDPAAYRSDLGGPSYMVIPVGRPRRRQRQAQARAQGWTHRQQDQAVEGPALPSIRSDRCRPNAAPQPDREV